MPPSSESRSSSQQPTQFQISVAIQRGESRCLRGFTALWEQALQRCLRRVCFQGQSASFRPSAVPPGQRSHAALREASGRLLPISRCIGLSPFPCPKAGKSPFPSSVPLAHFTRQPGADGRRHRRRAALYRVHRGLGNAAPRSVALVRGGITAAGRGKAAVHPRHRLNPAIGNGARRRASGLCSTPLGDRCLPGAWAEEGNLSPGNFGRAAAGVSAPSPPACPGGCAEAVLAVLCCGDGEEEL